MRTSDVDPKDYKYIVTKPDPSFSPKKNQAIIDETIREATKFFQETDAALGEGVEERIEAISYYATYRFNRGDKKIKDYLGRSTYEALVGEKMLSKLRVLDTLNKLQGKRDTKILL